MDIELLRKKLMPVFQRYGVTCCYLFGSRAGHDFYPDSDIDLAVIFNKFSTAKQNLAMEIEIRDAFAEILEPLEVDLLFLQKAPIYLKFNVIKNGKVVYSSDEEFRTDFEDATVRDYLDFKPVLDLYYREMAEAIVERFTKRFGSEIKVLGATSMQGSVPGGSYDILANDPGVLIADVAPEVVKEKVSKLEIFKENSKDAKRVDVLVNDLYWVADEFGLLKK